MEAEIVKSNIRYTKCISDWYCMQYTDRKLHCDNLTAMTNKLALQYRHAAFAICNESSFTALRNIHAFFYDSMDSHVENCNNAVLVAKYSISSKPF